MSALWVQLAALLCLCHTARSGPENSGVLWRDVGDSVTIQCRCPEEKQFFNVKKGLNRDVDVFFSSKGDKPTIKQEFKERLQVNGEFPNLDILIRNLTTEDTGPYWCIYQSFDKSNVISSDGTGSVLLVVKDNKKSPPKCEGTKEIQVLMIAVISAAVLLSIIMGFLLWLFKTKRANTAKPRRVPSNDVYEDMRGTIRR